MKYKSLDGLRAICALCILIMHIQANIGLTIKGFWYNTLIYQFANFVYLFMIISSFSMCCGYYSKVKKNEIDYNQFYSKRYKRLLPFFLVLVAIDVIRNHSLEALCEGFINATLMFGFLPNNKISIIGVGWFLGIVFIFYCVFPFFIFLINDKKRAWKSFFISLTINVMCTGYFFTNKFVLNSFWPKTNILYCAVYFITGGLLYLYKDDIIKKLKGHNILLWGSIIILSVLYFLIPKTLFNGLYVIKNLVLFTSYMIFAICYDGKLLNNKITDFIANISLEIYLAHMFIFRLIEMIHINRFISNEILLYLVTCILVICFTVIFSIIVDKMIEKLEKFFERANKSKQLRKKV